MGEIPIAAFLYGNKKFISRYGGNIMAQFYGDIPCVNLNGVIHITVSGTKCLCGQGYRYSKPDRKGDSVNIIWREIDAVTCDKCKKINEKRQ